MKTNFAILVAFMLIMTSCIKHEFDTPPVVVPYVDFESNTTIADLKAMYSGSGLDSIDSNIIIQGIITANDESGNIYKSMFIQDATGGIEIKIEKTDMYNIYRRGQRIYVKCKGLFLGSYGGVTQLGYKNPSDLTSTGRIPDVIVKNHLYKDSLPGNTPSPITISISQLNTSHIGMLVKFENISFPEAGQPFSTTTGTTNRTIQDENSQSILLRTSNYANFATTFLPSGNGNIIGILSAYNGDFQLYIRDLNDVIFLPDNSTFLINEPFTSSLNTFTAISVTGTQTWYHSTYGGKTFAKISGFSNSTGYDNEDWLISPSFSMDATTNETLKFLSAMSFGNVNDGSLKVFFTNAYTGDPTTTTWNEITGYTLSSGSYEFTNSGSLDISAFSGSDCRIGFKYTCGTANVPTWELTNIVLKGNPMK